MSYAHLLWSFDADDDVCLSSSLRYCLFTGYSGIYWFGICTFNDVIQVSRMGRISILAVGLFVTMYSCISRMYFFRSVIMSLDSFRSRFRESSPWFRLSTSVSRSSFSAPNIEKSRVRSMFSFFVIWVELVMSIAAIFVSAKSMFMLSNTKKRVLAIYL